MKLVFPLAGFLILQGSLVYLALIRIPAEYSGYVSGYGVHFVAFLLTTVLLYMVLSHKAIGFRYALGLAFVYAVGVAYLVEVVQGRLEYRTYDLMDFAFGSIGAGVAIAALFMRRLIEKAQE